MQYYAPEFRAKVKAGQQVVVAGTAFGVGSSREQAPRALKGTVYLCKFFPNPFNARILSFFFG